MAPTVRPGRDDDAPGFIDLISGCWAEYPGCVFDLEGEVPELLALASYFEGLGGALWVAEQAGRVIGMTGVSPLPANAWEIRKMYVARDFRATGLAVTLLATAEEHAVARGANQIKLWSDTRFDRAHHFYEKHSFVRSGPIRALGDKSNSIEFAYAKPFNAVGRLDAAAAVSAIPRLSKILIACVDGGAAVGFLAPLAPEAATKFWKQVARDVASGTTILVAAWVEGVLAGTVQVDLATSADQTHRGEVRKLLVLPEARRCGVARTLMGRAEAEAREAGLTLLTLHTRAEDAGEPLFRSLAWQEAGRLPGYALSADGTPHETVFFYRQIA